MCIFRFELIGDKTGSEGAESKFRGRAVVMDGNVDNNIHSSMPMKSNLEGDLIVQTKPGDKEILFVVASVPEYYKSHQTYGYQVKISSKRLSSCCYSTHL